MSLTVLARTFRFKSDVVDFPFASVCHVCLCLCVSFLSHSISHERRGLARLANLVRYGPLSIRESPHLSLFTNVFSLAL